MPSAKPHTDIVFNGETALCEEKNARLVFRQYAKWQEGKVIVQTVLHDSKGASGSVQVRSVRTFSASADRKKMEEQLEREWQDTLDALDILKQETAAYVDYKTHDEGDAKTLYAALAGIAAKRLADLSACRFPREQCHHELRAFFGEKKRRRSIRLDAVEAGILHVKQTLSRMRDKLEKADGADDILRTFDRFSDVMDAALCEADKMWWATARNPSLAPNARPQLTDALEQARHLYVQLTQEMADAGLKELAMDIETMALGDEKTQGLFPAAEVLAARGGAFQFALERGRRAKQGQDVSR